MNANLSTDSVALYDLAIIGGGPVGAALALALQGGGLKICVLEARAENAGSQDARALALSYGSRLLLQRLGVWDALPDVSPIRTIHISQQKSFGRSLLQAADLDVPELGYVLPYAALQAVLDKVLGQAESRVLYGSQVIVLNSTADGTTIRYQQNGVEKELQTRLAVVADGGKLLAAQHPPEVRDYGQSALISHVTCAAPQADTAFERFTPHGPIALLPFHAGYELVWTAPHATAQAMLGWSEAQFLQELHAQFGDRVGEFLSVGQRVCFPLGLKRAPNITPQAHTVLIGNAAQTLHPVAGQGFNLGLRDAWELAQAVLRSTPENLGTAQMLAGYCQQRRTDRESGIGFTDGLVRLFSNDLPLLSAGRAAALSALDCLPLAKKFVAKRMMFGAQG
jgi:2-octaprenyl-6-methoxyphenol hydroxylase